MVIKINYCTKVNVFGGGTQRLVESRHYIEASTEIFGHTVSAQSKYIEKRITFEQAEVLKKEAKMRLVEKVNKIIEEDEHNRKMSEILSAEEVELWSKGEFLQLYIG